MVGLEHDRPQRGKGGFTNLDRVAAEFEPLGKTVCDILALRRDNGRSTPVLLELKDARMLKRLKAQVESYAKLIDEHAPRFEELYGELLGIPIAFNGPVEKWMVWPGEGIARDPREEELIASEIRLVGYAETGPGLYEFKVGPAAASAH
jgi:hypothetical protein